MSQDIYSKLRDRLDQYSMGYPTTESGVEMEILHKLFDQDEAGMFLHMSPSPETAASVSERTGKDPDETQALLERMAGKGLLFRFKKSGTSLYSAIPFVVGIFEYQVNNMDKEFAGMMDRYFEEGFAEAVSRQIAPLRPIAVNRAIDASTAVATYDDTRAMIESQEQIAVAKCICRMEKNLLDKGCDKPSEVCLAFGPHASYCVDIGMSRWISQEEALEIMDRCEKAGLVPMPANSQVPVAICNCCGDCCGVLASIKKHPRPAETVVSNQYAAVGEELCVGCEICLERCQMEAIALGPDDIAAVELDRCIGCGLCVTTCPEEAISLKAKPESQRREPPLKLRDTVIEIQQTRGSLA